MININFQNFRNKYEKICDSLTPEYIYPAVKRVIAIGDIHGDFDILIKLLNIADLIDINNNWKGGNTYVIQLGDQIDRFRPTFHNNNKTFNRNDENSDIRILEYLINLNTQALKTNGRVISLLGNHELMNVEGNMEYVSYKGLIGFANELPNKLPNKTPVINKKNNLTLGIENRKFLFSPGQYYAKLLACTRSVSIIIGQTLFVHGGLLESVFNKYKLEDINKLMTLYLFGLLKDGNLEMRQHYDKIYTNNLDSPLWTRDYSIINDCKCDKLFKDALDRLNITRIIVGHTVLGNNEKYKCGERIIFADCHASKAFDTRSNLKRKKFVIEITNDTEINFLTLA